MAKSAHLEGETDAETRGNRDAALDAYGRDLIGPDDMLIERIGVTPKFDENGKLIPRHQPQPSHGG